MQWNEEQNAAITHMDGDLLVAAGAGSGKTAVLVERLIRQLEDPALGLDLERFLLVTFTRAAAAEMRAKIAKALTERLAMQPNSKRLRRQLEQLPRAHITTVDSFCTTLLREQFQSVGLSPDFRVADEDACAVLRRQALIPLIEARYASGDPDFLHLADTVSSGRSDDALLTVIDTAHRQMSAHPDPAQWAAAMQEEEPDFDRSPFVQAVYKELQEFLDAWRMRYTEMLRSFKDDPVQEPLIPAYAGDLDTILALGNLLEAGHWDAIVDFLADIRFITAGRIKKTEQNALTEQVKKQRDVFKEKIKQLRTRYFAFHRAQIEEAAALTLPVRRALMDTVMAFDEAYSALKRRRNCIDFSDAEHMALRILAEKKDGVYVPTAVAASMDFAEILVDEYQDSNGVQDAIFHALAGNRGRLFFVGDMKQSIYRFRMADPSIFYDKYTHFADDPAPGAPRRILLGRNYRSRKPVLDAVNDFFARIMTTALGEMDYTEKEYLRYGEGYAQGENPIARLCLVDPGDTEDAAIYAEARFVAAEIRRMVDGGSTVLANGVLRPMVWHDAAILLRSMGSTAQVFRRALEEQGIPVDSAPTEKLYDSVEVRSVCSLLSCIDNPRQDVALAAVMRMPFLPFSADALAVLRLHHPDGFFWEAVFAAAEHPEDAAGDALYAAAANQCRRLLELLDTLRADAISKPLDAFFQQLLHDLGLLGLYGAMEDGEQRQANLLALAEQATKFEQSGYRGLYRFVSFLRKQSELKSASAESAQPCSVGGVQMVTMHRSKGLEYPVVFVSGCGRKFNDQDLRQPVLLHRDLGAGLYYRDTAAGAEYPTLARNAIALTQRREMRSEELRILYVAMTRAKERLICTAAVQDAAEVLETAQPQDAQALGEKQNYLGWLLGVLCQGTPHWRVEAITAPENAAAKASETESLPADADTEALRQRLAYVYPHGSAAVLPSKVTATGFTREQAEKDGALLPGSVPVEDDSAGESAEHPVPALRPAFLTHTDAEVLTPAQRGVALHMAMQYLDYAKGNTAKSVQEELERLERQQYLTPAQAKSVSPERIVRFFRSPLGQRLQAAQVVRREWRFSLLADAEKVQQGIFADAAHPEDASLLQGVIDCFFLEYAPDGSPAWVIIDFKTDYVPAGGENAVAAHYAPQLAVYAAALERMTGIPAAHRMLYLFSAGKAVEAPQI